MSGSGASNLGYGEIYPNSNVDGAFVNKTSTDFSAFFTDNTIPTHGIKGASSNVMAAQGIVPCQKGGGKKLRNKKNKSLYYKKTMKHVSRRKMSHRRKMSRKSGGKRHSKMTHRRRRVHRRTRGKFIMRGGYDQYGNNVAYTPNYSTGGPLPSGLSALANPAPYHILKGDGLCQDSYNHYAAR